MHLAICCRGTRIGLVGLAWLAVVNAIFISRAEAQPNWTTIALSGVENEYGPQLGPGITFGSLDAFDVNSRNHFVLRGTLSAPDTFPAVGGVWSFDHQTKGPIAFVRRESVTDPDMFRRVERVVLDEAGTIVFEGSKEPAPLGSFDIWLHEDGQTTPVVKRGDPGLVGLRGPRLANKRVIFWGTRGDSFDGDLWAGTSAGIAPIAQQRTDGPLGPNLGPGVQFTGIKPFYQATASGEAILLGGVTGGDSDGIWRTTPDGPQPLALEGAANHLGPNLGDGVVFTEIWQELGAEKGVDHLAFRATFAGDVAGIGIFKVGTTGNTLIALANSDGPLGPQLGPGISFGVPEARSVNNRGDVLVSSNISGANKPQRGVWINQGNGNVPVALTLTDALHGPQLGDGIEFLGIQQEDQYVDESGQVVFSALLRGTNVDASNDAGAWAWSNGRLYPLLREGELLNIDAGGGGYQRRVQSFSLGQGGDSFMAFDRPAASQGLIPLRIEFDDGSSGIFVTQIPEPSSNALVVFGLMSIAVWRGRKRAR